MNSAPSAPLHWKTRIRFRRILRIALWVAVLVLGSDFCFSASPPAGGDARRVFGAFDSAVACSVDPNGFVFVIDGGRNAVQKYDGTTGELLITTGGAGRAGVSFDQPGDIQSPNGIDVYVADYGNHRIMRFDRNLSAVSSLPPSDDRATRPERQFGYPRSVAVDRFGSVYVVDGENTQIVKMDSRGTVQTFGGIGGGKGRLLAPAAIRVAGDDVVYVQDGNTVVMFDIFGNYINRLDGGVFHALRAIAVDGATVYAVDSCALVVIGNRGGAVNRYLFPPDDRAACARIVGCAVAGDRLFLLEVRTIRSFSIKDIVLPKH